MKELNLEDLTEGVARLIADQELAVGIQLTAIRDSTSIDIAVGQSGDGVDLQVSDEMRIFCSGKPLVATAAIDFLRRAEVPLDLALQHAAPLATARLPRHCADYTIEDLLQHATSLLLPKGLVAQLLPTDLLRGLVHADASRMPADVRGYSSISTWTLLASVVEEQGGNLEQLVAETAASLGLRHTFFGRVGYDSGPRQVAVGAMWGGRSWLPMLSDRVPEFLDEFDPALGGYSTAGDLARYWHRVGHAVAGTSKEAVDAVLASQTATRRGDMLDWDLHRVCDFGLGMMVNLPRHWDDTGDLGADSFGHSGYLGTSFGCHSTEGNLSIGCVVVGIRDGVAAIRHIRPAIIQLLLG